MKNLTRMLLFGLLFLYGVDSKAQSDKPGTGVYLGVYYGISWPGADLADRFGRNFSIGGNLELFLNRKWIVGIDGQFMFGNDVHENVAGGIVTDRGELINTNFHIASVEAKERGFNFNAKFGRVHDLWSKYDVSGIKWTFGVGYLQHKIRLKDSENAVPFFEEDYIRGYDRLSSGIAFTQFIGYQYLDLGGNLNLFGGVEFVEGFTKNRRGLSYNTKTIDDEGRFDFLVGLKAGVQITIRGYKTPDKIWY